MRTLCIISILALAAAGCDSRQAPQQNPPINFEPDAIEVPGQVLPEQIDPVPPV